MNLKGNGTGTVQEETHKNNNKDNKKCNAEGCEEIATETIKIPAGRFGCVKLAVCKNCVGKFLDD
jgi:hypothetical protein